MATYDGFRTFAAAAAIALASVQNSSAAVPRPASGGVPRIAHVTVIVMENRANERIVGNPNAPYFNEGLLPLGVLMTDSHAIAHPSQPNYLALFSGSSHGVTSDACLRPLDGPNLETEARSAGLTFTGYAESMPRDGYRGCWTLLYARKHVPWATFRNVPPSDNLVYRGFPAEPASITFVIPNMCHDMHDCTTSTGDRWLARNVPPIVAWNAKNDGLLAITWDEAEPDTDGTNRIPTILIGPMLNAGTTSSQRIDHYALLRTIEVALGLGCLDRDCSSRPIGGVWRRPFVP